MMIELFWSEHMCCIERKNHKEFLCISNQFFWKKNAILLLLLSSLYHFYMSEKQKKKIKNKILFMFRVPSSSAACFFFASFNNVFFLSKKYLHLVPVSSFSTHKGTKLNILRANTILFDYWTNKLCVEIVGLLWCLTWRSCLKLHLIWFDDPVG